VPRASTISTATATATATATSVGADPNAPRRPWDDVPLRTKTCLLIAVAAVAGVIVGMIESHAGHLIWPLLGGLGLVTVTLWSLAVRWTCRPLDRLLAQLDGVNREQRPSVLSRLPTDRRDEIGRLARVLHRLSADAVRDYHEARRLRRTLDDRVERATQQATQKLQQLAMRDALTGLGNRHFFEENFEPLFESCRASGTDLLCIAIDVDNLKLVNDTLGHKTGDDLLLFLGNLIRASIRHEDYAARVGGDEFVVLMPGCGGERGEQFAGRLIALFRQHAHLAVRTDTRPDLSIGIADLHRDNLRDSASLLLRADERLYAAKRAGRGQVASS